MNPYATHITSQSLSVLHVIGLYKGTEYGSCEKVTWNPPGEGLLFEDLGVPIFSFTEQSDVDTILQKVADLFCLEQPQM